MRLRSISDWSTVNGSGEFAAPDEGARRVSIPVVTEGGTFIVQDGNGAQTLVGYGEGKMQLDFAVSGAFTLLVVADGMTSLLLPWQRDVDAGWENGDSFVQVELKSREEVSPAVRDMMERMNRNFMLREATLRAEMENRLRRLQPPAGGEATP